MWEDAHDMDHWLDGAEFADESRSSYSLCSFQADYHKVCISVCGAMVVWTSVPSIRFLLYVRLVPILFQRVSSLF